MQRLSFFQRACESWGFLLGVPALFFLAYIYPYLPVVPDLELCAVRHFLFVPCPGCGLTRSFVALMHGNVRSSITYNALGIVIVVWLIYMFIRAVYLTMAGESFPELLKQCWRDFLLYAFLIAMILQWVVRLVAGSWHPKI